MNKYYDSDSVDYGKLQNQLFFLFRISNKIHNNREFTELVDQLPSGNLTYIWKITIFNGKIHYFYGHFQ